MDITDTLAPDSDQLDGIDLAGGPQTFTVKSVSRGNAEQPVNVHLAEFPRGPWRPGKNMRRVLAACWGADASAWVGRRVELYFDPTVTFGKDTPGGTRIAALSNIDKAQKIPLLVSRGKSAVYTVQPLKIASNAPGDRQSPVEPNRGLIPTEGEPAFGANPDPSTEGGGESGTGASQSEAETPAESPLWQAVEQQMDALTSHQQARLAKLCKTLEIKATRDGLIDAWGEGARDLVGMCESVEARLDEVPT